MRYRWAEEGSGEGSEVKKQGNKKGSDWLGKTLAVPKPRANPENMIKPDITIRAHSPPSNLNIQAHIYANAHTLSCTHAHMHVSTCLTHTYIRAQSP